MAPVPAEQIARSFEGYYEQLNMLHEKLLAQIDAGIPDGVPYSGSIESLNGEIHAKFLGISFAAAPRAARVPSGSLWFEYPFFTNFCERKVFVWSFFLTPNGTLRAGTNEDEYQFADLGGTMTTPRILSRLIESVLDSSLLDPLHKRPLQPEDFFPGPRIC